MSRVRGSSRGDSDDGTVSLRWTGRAPRRPFEALPRRSRRRKVPRACLDAMAGRSGTTPRRAGGSAAQAIRRMSDTAVAGSPSLVQAARLPQDRPIASPTVAAASVPSWPDAATGALNAWMLNLGSAPGLLRRTHAHVGRRARDGD